MSNFNVVFVTTSKFMFYCVICKGYLQTNYDIKSRIFLVNKNDDLVVGENEIVVPFTFEGMEYSYGLPNCLVMNPNQTKFLNDKQSCGEYIDLIGIPNIPTFYNRKTQTTKDLVNFTNKFSKNSTYCIKGRTTSASRDIEFVNKDTLLNKYENSEMLRDYIIQLYIESDYILAMDCVCYKGKIKGFLINKSPLFFRKEDKFIKNRFVKYTHELLNDKSNNLFYNRVYDNTKQIVESVEYDGFIEIEWLCREGDNTLLFLEINPRMSGNLNYSNYRDLSNVSLPYIDVILVNYIATIIELNFKKNKNKTIANNLRKNIPCKFPKKITKGSYNLGARPVLALISLIIIVVLVSKLNFSK